MKKKLFNEKYDMSIHKGKNGYGDPSNSHVDFTLSLFSPYMCVIGWHMENCAKHSPLKITVKKKTHLQASS